MKPVRTRTMLDVQAIRRDFPILGRQVHGKPLVYLDNAATTQKPRAVIDALVHFYEHQNANIHRAIHTLGEEATAAYEETRARVSRFINAPRPENIVFTRGATEALNLVAYAWGRANVREGDEIVLTQMEHHSNMVPWQRLAQEVGATVKYIGVTDEGTLDLDGLDDIITEKTKLVSVTQISNASTPATSCWRRWSPSRAAER
jgi:cysteine desulfurase/selenocysteine lyase